MNLHENSQAFANAIRAASDHFDIREIFIEKDYWVTFILRRLSLSENKDKVVFKGGTSLSKVYKLIERFSEDIDLAIIKEPGQSDNQIGRLIKSLQTELISGFNEVITPNTTKHKNFRRTEYDYNRVVESDASLSSGVNRNLVLEINSLADPVPNGTHQIRSIIAEFLEETGNTEAINNYNLQPFKLNVLVPRPTLIEKILSIIRLSYFDDGIDRIRSKVRHFYDIYFLAGSDYCNEYIKAPEFIQDFKKMYAEDKTKFNDPEKWIGTSYKESPALNTFDDIWDKVKYSYETDFRLLVYGKFPSETEVSDNFRELIKVLKK
ncbi:MAG: nucleotidyl transferase AbiEii/AbiGii toxin family protein [Bacteroidales bacterium]|nr:nucleotidyl transferase AbiEii/AbiGii toxin family protein [Bacteroidales bacterium]MBN2862187.1 nucleotidyl transferase AbiEii/AbiGii toxin family protein [Bacteroidales bacterium]